MMANLNDQPWAEFADRLAQELLEHGATEAAIVTRNEDEDRVVTNYYNCNFEKRCVLIGHLIHDLILEVIETNADTIREMLEDDNANPD
jgi:hypothetical protein